MKKHGLIVADNGSDMYVSGTFDLQWPARFDAGFHPQFKTLRASDFEVVELGWVGVPELKVASPNGGRAGRSARSSRSGGRRRPSGRRARCRVSLVNGASTTVLATVPSTQTSLAWTVSGSTTTSARVRVECVGCASAVQDESDATFSIVAATAPPPVPSDFNADGRPDLLWHHQVMGDLYTWLLSGTVTSSGAYLDPAAVRGHAVADPGPRRLQRRRQGGRAVAPPGDGGAVRLVPERDRGDGGCLPQPEELLGHAVADPRGDRLQQATASRTSCGTTRRAGNSTSGT